MANWRDLANELEELIRKGQGEKARELISNIDESKLPRNHSVQFSRLARRCHHIAKAFCFVRESFLEIKDRLDANPALAIEYAFLLSIVGSQKVALKILTKLSRLNVPLPAEYHFVTGCVDLSFWNYRGAEKHFREFVTATDDGYMRAVGQLNLISCLVVQKKTQEADELLRQIEKVLSSDSSWQVLSAHLNELKGQKFFHDGDFVKARIEFHLAHTTLQASGHPSLDFVNKWLLFMDFLDGGKTSSIQPLVDFQNEMKVKRQYEICREIDRFIGEKTDDERRRQRVFFGTPFRCYKEIFFPTKTFTNQYLWSESALTPTTTIDLLENRVNHPGGTAQLPAALHRLLTGLSMDFYKTVNYGALFELIYPQEYYDPVHGPNRIFQLVNRLRRFFHSHKIDLEIVKSDTGFSLRMGQQVGIWVKANLTDGEESDTGHEVWDQRIATRFTDQDFDSKTFAGAFEVSQRSASRLLSQLVESGILEKQGSGRSVVYRRLQSSANEKLAA